MSSLCCRSRWNTGLGHGRCIRRNGVSWLVQQLVARLRVLNRAVASVDVGWTVYVSRLCHALVNCGFIFPLRSPSCSYVRSLVRARLVVCLSMSMCLSMSISISMSMWMCMSMFMCLAIVWSGPAGQYSEGNATSCSPCDAGTYGTGASTDAHCTGSCPLGQFSTPGSAACSCCPIGTYGSAVGLQSAACSGNCSAVPGYACIGTCLSSGSGTACPAGQFSSVAGATACTPCSVGQYAPSSGALVVHRVEEGVWSEQETGRGTRSVG